MGGFPYEFLVVQFGAVDMPISDVTLVAQILFAETQDFVDDPNAPAGLGLERLRAVLAWMIFRSESGSGYVAPLVPDIGVLGSKTRFPIWQACVTAAEQPISPAQVDGRDPDVTFPCDQDPTTDANLLKAFPWLAAKPPAPAVGRHLARPLGLGAKRARFAPSGSCASHRSLWSTYGGTRTCKSAPMPGAPEKRPVRPAFQG